MMKKQMLVFGVLAIGVFVFTTFVLQQKGSTPNVYGLLGGPVGNRGEGESCSGKDLLGYSDNCGPGLICKITESDRQSHIGEVCNDKKYSYSACECQKKHCTRLLPARGETCSMGQGTCDGGFCVTAPGGIRCECEYCGNGVADPGEECESSIDGEGRCYQDTCKCREGYEPDGKGKCLPICDPPFIYYGTCICPQMINDPELVCKRDDHHRNRGYEETCQEWIECDDSQAGVCTYTGDTCMSCIDCGSGKADDCPNGCQTNCDPSASDNCVQLDNGETAYQRLYCNESGICTAGLGGGNNGGDGGPGPGPGPNSSAPSSQPPSPGPGPGPGGNDGGEGGDEGEFTPSLGSSSAGNTSISSAINTSAASSANTSSSAASLSDQSSDESNSSSNSSSTSHHQSSLFNTPYSSAYSTSSSLAASEHSDDSEFSSVFSSSVESSSSSSSSSTSVHFESSNISSSSLSSQIPMCGDGIVEGDEECDSGSICSQNIAMTCIEDIDCRQCLLVNGIGRCGGTPQGPVCIRNQDCINEIYFCTYNTTDDECDDTCRFIRSSSSSLSFVSEESSQSTSSLIASSITSYQSTTSSTSETTPSSSSSDFISSLPVSSVYSSEESSSTSTSTIVAHQSSSETPLLGAVFCGNGSIEGAEECDDGNVRNGDGCSASCFSEIIQPHLVAAASICGNGTLDSSEECDDGNIRDGDGCNTVCLLEIGICGDGIVQSLLGEQCETSLHNDALGYSCVDCRFMSTVCGNAIIDPGEECDAGALNSTSPDAPCRPDCSLPRCGDLIVDASELCDDGNRTNGDGCDRFCKTENNDTLVAGEVTVPTTPAPVQQVTYQPPQQQFQFPQFPTQQPVSYQLPLAQLQPLIQTRGPVGDTGPATVAVIVSGMAAGFGWARRKK